MTDDIVQKLNELSRWLIANDADMKMPAGMIDPAVAADTITRLTAEVERLRAALERAAHELELLYFFAISNGIAEAGIPPHVQARAALKDRT